MKASYDAQDFDYATQDEEWDEPQFIGEHNGSRDNASESFRTATMIPRIRLIICRSGTIMSEVLIAASRIESLAVSAEPPIPNSKRGT